MNDKNTKSVVILESDNLFLEFALSVCEISNLIDQLTTIMGMISYEEIPVINPEDILLILRAVQTEHIFYSVFDNKLVKGCLAIEPICLLQYVDEDYKVGIQFKDPEE